MKPNAEFSKEFIDRVDEFIEKSGINRGDFKKKCKLSKSTLSNIRVGLRNVGEKVIDKILFAYPELNKNWLMTGEGSMMNATVAISHPKNVSDFCKRLNQLYNYLSKRHKVLSQNDFAQKVDVSSSTMSVALRGNMNSVTKRFKNKITKAYGKSINMDWLFNGVGDMVRSHKKKIFLEEQPLSLFDEQTPEEPIEEAIDDAVPEVEEPAQVEEKTCTCQECHCHEHDDEECHCHEHQEMEVIGACVIGRTSDGLPTIEGEEVKVDIPNYRHCTVSVKAKDNSMYPEIGFGYQMLLGKYDKEYVINWGGLYFVVLHGGQGIACRLYPGENNKLICRRRNDKVYPDITIDREDIQSIYTIGFWIGCEEKKEEEVDK